MKFKRLSGPKKITVSVCAALIALALTDGQRPLRAQLLGDTSLRFNCPTAILPVAISAAINRAAVTFSYTSARLAGNETGDASFEARKHSSGLV